MGMLRNALAVVATLWIPSTLACVAEQPCVVGGSCRIVDKKTLTDSYFRNGAPAIAVDGSYRASIVYSRAVAGFHGFYATQDTAGAWTVTPTPFEIAEASHVSMADGTPWVLNDNGSFGGSLHTLTSSNSWSEIVVPERVLGYSAGLARDDHGNFHAAFIGDDTKVKYGHYTNSWEITSLDQSGSGGVPLSLSPTGVPHLIWWTSDLGGGWTLSWVSQPGSPETVAPLGSSVLGQASQQLGIATSGPDSVNPTGKPHAAFVRPINNGRHSELVYATRQGVNNWGLTVIITDQLADEERCQFLDQTPRTCNQRYNELTPIGIVASPSGVVQIVYAVNQIKRTRVLSCDSFGPGFGGPPRPTCNFRTTEDFSTSKLFVATITPDVSCNVPHTHTVDIAEVGSLELVAGGNVVKDNLNRLHVALYEQVDSGTRVTYVRIAA